MKSNRWALSSSTCHVHIQFEIRVSYVHGQIREYLNTYIPPVLTQEMEFILSLRGMK